MDASLRTPVTRMRLPWSTTALSSQRNRPSERRCSGAVPGGDAAEPCPEGGTAERNRPSEWRVRVAAPGLLLAFGAEALERVDQHASGVVRRDHDVDVAALGRDVRVEEPVLVLGHQLGLLLRPLDRIVDGLQAPAVK